MMPLRVIVVFLEAPVPFGNAAARWYYVLLRELVARGHRVTAFAACSKTTEIDEAKQLFPAPEYDLRLYAFPDRSGLIAKLATVRRPYSYMFSRELKQDLAREMAAGYDVLHLEQLWTGWLACRHRNRSIVNVLNSYRIDLGPHPPVGLRNQLERWLVFWAERRLMRSFQRFITLSLPLQDEIHRINPQAEISIVPLGIDTTLYQFIPLERRQTGPVIGLIGSMVWYPTHSAAVRLITRLWPEIKRRVPAARLQLVGWGAKAALAEYLHLSDVTIAENVPDTRPYFENTSVMLYAPGRGSGMKIKILEAFGYGVPVVTTSEGVEGIPAVDGVHAGVCEDDSGLIDRTVALLNDPMAQNRQRAAARALLGTHCGPKPTVDAIEAIYQSICYPSLRNGEPRI